jgi:Mg2+/Co2+ transporter CorB
MTQESFTLGDVVGTGLSSALSLFAAGACAAFATALSQASRARLAQLERDGSSRARELNRLWPFHEAMQGALLFLKAISGSTFTAILLVAFWRVFGGGGAVFATVLAAAMLFIFADIVPRALGRQHADALSLWFGGAARGIKILLWPFIVVLDAGVRPALRAAGLGGQKPKDEETAHAEIREAIDSRHLQGAVHLSDRNMLGGILDLKELQIADVMVHRQNMVMLNLDQPAEKLLDLVLSQRHTRLPLYRGNPDNIVGVLHAKDLLKALPRAKGNIAGINILALAARPWFVPDTTLLADQLRAFLQRRTHFALVVDEYGALQGLITLEDILEEIVGEIRDEHDLPLSGVRPQADGTVFVDGWVSLRELNRARNWTLPDERATTIAGLVIHEAQSIPDTGQVFSFFGFKFEIVARDRNQVTAIRITPPRAETQALSKAS